MQQQQQWQVPILLLVVFAAAVCSAKQPANTYADFVASKTGAAVQSEGYQSEPREFVHTCLKELSNKNCMALAASDYFESGLACCDPRSQSGNSLGSSNIEVGSCKFSQSYLAEPIAEAPGVQKWGEFSVQCYMNAASDTCGHPFCDQMVLSAAGGIYWAEDVVLASRPIAPMMDNMCTTAGGRKASFPPALRGKKFRGEAAKPVAGAGGKPAQAAVADAGRHVTPSLHSGSAWIFFGPMSVNSRVHDVKISQGWFEYVNDYVVGLPMTEYDAEGKHVVDPFTYSLKFYKPSQSSY